MVGARLLLHQEAWYQLIAVPYSRSSATDFRWCFLLTTTMDLFVNMDVFSGVLCRSCGSPWGDRNTIVQRSGSRSNSSRFPEILLLSFTGTRDRQKMVANPRRPTMLGGLLKPSSVFSWVLDTWVSFSADFLLASCVHPALELALPSVVELNFFPQLADVLLCETFFSCTLLL